MATGGVIRVSAPVTLTQLHLAPITAAYLLKTPSVRIDLVADDRMVDAVGEGFDLVIRSGPATHQSLTVRKLARDERVLCAAPAYLARAGTPRAPEALSRVNCMRHALNDGAGRWQIRTSGGVRAINVRGNLRVNHGGALKAAALQGLGIAYLPRFIVDEALRSGALVRVLPDVEVVAAPFVIALHPYGRRLPPRIRGYLDHLAAHLPGRLGQRPLKR